MRNFYAFLLACFGLFGIQQVNAQCPQITCPTNITTNAANGNCAATVSFAAPVGTNPCGGSTTATFNYTGAQQSFTVPVGITSITVDAQGAQGGGNGGLGGRAIATIPVTPGEVLQVWVGGRPTAQLGPGGFNGGGAITVEPCGSGPTYSWPGAGASDIRRGSGYANRLIVGGGGGGQGWSTGLGGGGGGTTGVDGAASWIAGTNGKGGTQIAGGIGGFYSGNGQSSPNGTLGVGGNASPLNTYCTGGGGGGGYYGGGGGYVSAGGGGSSYVAYPGNTSTSTTASFRAGNGIVTITYTGAGSATTTQLAGLASGASFPVGATTNTFSVSDGLGNSASCSFSVTVVDAQAPSITCPANITANNTVGTCGAVVNYAAPVGTDNCSGVTSSRTVGLASGASFPIGTTTVTYQATDAAGLTATCSFTVAISDNEAPAITCPSNIVANNTTGSCDAIVSYNAPTGTDNCTGVTSNRTAGLASGSTFPIGATTVTYLATDLAGLTATCSFTVTVNDTEAPTINCPSNVTINADSSTCGAAVSFNTPAGTDNCGAATTLQTAGLASGATFPVGVTTQVFGATDGAGNTTTCSFSVTVVDIETPTISCPSNVSAAANGAGCTATVTYNTPVGTDNCTNSSTVLSGGFASGAAFPSGVTTVTYTVADQSGNSATCSFTVTVSGNVSSTQNLTICNGASVTVGTNTYSTAGVYTDLLANAFGCDSVVTTVLSVTNVNTGTTLNGIVLSAAANGATYQWLDCDNGNAAISGATSQTFTPSVNGNYAVVVTENGCTDTSACTSVTVVGLQEAFGSEFSLHPNPSNGLVTVEFGQSLSDLEIRVTDLTGKVLYAKDHVNGNQVLLDMRSLSHGVYLVEVRSADLRKALRMVVQ